MIPLFLDTGYLIALEVIDDQYHEVALQHWTDISKNLPPLITTSYVFDEVVTFFNARNYHSKAVEIGDNILNSPSIQLIQVDEQLFKESWGYFKKHNDKGYSFTDCVSFTVINRFGIKTALTFDNHFVQAGFKRLP
ncbi:MAG: PIN domain-containing protein [Nitrospirae bacterium]|nr:PIN domain-containing protein [Nitrospirota bacterium]